MEILSKRIIYFSKERILACDGKCSKAFGIDSRPTNSLSNDPDDYEYLSDREAGEAPEDPGTYEGSQGKPIDKNLNKWCARQCERSLIAEIGESIKLEDFSKRISNTLERTNA